MAKSANTLQRNVKDLKKKVANLTECTERLMEIGRRDRTMIEKLKDEIRELRKVYGVDEMSDITLPLGGYELMSKRAESETGYWVGEGGTVGSIHQKE